MGAYDERPAFYEGQYLSAADLAAVVDYLRGVPARLALGAHTWGIALGLDLTERSAPGPANRREVILQPGWARDGYGRSLLVQQPTRLPENLFAAIPYNAALDDPALPGGPTGRLVKVWLHYTETTARPPAPGFEVCGAEGAHARVQEGFEFLVGELTGGQQRGSVTIGAELLDAQQALRFFDAAAPLLWDTSVAHQSFPTTGKPPRWAVPLGWVRWVAGNGVLGYFIDRALVAVEEVDKKIRAFRRYGGTVTENIEAAAGAIVMRRRGDTPTDPNRFAQLLSSTQPLADLLADLVWVEGNLRVEGDARMAGGRLLMRNAAGLDEGTNLYLARWGDNPASGVAGLRELRAVIGVDTQTTNRFVVGPELSAAPPPGVVPPQQSPQLVVVSSGQVGINLFDPAHALHVRGARLRLESADQLKRIDLRTDGAATDVHSETSKLYLRASGPAVTQQNQVVINPFKASDGEVGIGTQTPEYGLDVDEPDVRFKLSAGNGGQFVLRGNAAAADKDKVFVEASDGAAAAPAPELRFSGPAGANLPRLASYADTTYVRGKLGVNLEAPAADTRVHVRGTRIRLESEDALRSIDLRTDGSSVDVQTATSHLYLRSTTPGGPPTRHIVMNPGTDDGNVGVGTAAPTEKLHVHGNFMRVDGSNNEQAVVGGEGHNSVVLGTRSAGVTLADMRNLTVAFDTTNAAAWLTVWCRSVTEVSDARAKAHVRPITHALDNVMQLRGVSYRWQPAPGAREADDDGEHLGLIAQEVRQVLPQAVTVNERGAGITYSALVPVLIEAMKELKAQVDELQAQLQGRGPS